MKPALHLGSDLVNSQPATRDSRPATLIATLNSTFNPPQISTLKFQSWTRLLRETAEQLKMRFGDDALRTEESHDKFQVTDAPGLKCVFQTYHLGLSGTNMSCAGQVLTSGVFRVHTWKKSSESTFDNVLPETQSGILDFCIRCIDPTRPAILHFEGPMEKSSLHSLARIARMDLPNPCRGQA
jgi:hypothetical protein